MDVRLHERGEGCRTAKNNAGRIRNRNGPVFLLAPQTVCHPQRAVNAGNEWLNPVALMDVDIADNLREVEDVHEYRGYGCYARQDREKSGVNIRFFMLILGGGLSAGILCAHEGPFVCVVCPAMRPASRTDRIHKTI